MIPISKPIVGLREWFAVGRVLRSKSLAQGSEVLSLEKEFSNALVGGRATVAVNSGTSGQHLGLVASRVGRGDEVIVPSFTFAATANCVVLAGAKPVFCDIDPVTFTLDINHLKTLIGPRTRGIMPVHLFGHPADMHSLMELATDKSLGVYEDAAQAHGASIDGRMVGTFGDFAMFSLYPTKNMTSGEGGIVACATEEAARMVRLLRNQGMEHQYHNEIVGYNNRMTDIHAAIGRVQLRRLTAWNAKRRRNASYLNERIEGVTTPSEKAGVEHVYHQYTVRVLDDRDGFQRALSEQFGVASGIYYPVPTHRLPSLRKYSKNVNLPETDLAAKQVLSLPVHPLLTMKDLDKIAYAVNRLSKAGGTP